MNRFLDAIVSLVIGAVTGVLFMTGFAFSVYQEGGIGFILLICSILIMYFAGLWRGATLKKGEKI